MGHMAKQIGSYRIRVYGNSKMGIQGALAWIALYGSARDDLISTIGFYTPEELESKQDYVDEQEIVRAHMKIDVLQYVVHLLLNEQRIFIHWADSLQQMWLDTGGPEPIGEEE